MRSAAGPSDAMIITVIIFQVGPRAGALAIVAGASVHMFLEVRNRLRPAKEARPLKGLGGARGGR